MTRWFRQAVLDRPGYVSPPQQNYRVKLNQNESPFDVPAQLKKELTEAALQLEWNRYPVYRSLPLTERLAERHGVLPEHILPGNGSNQLLQTVLMAALQPDEAVLYTVPTFSLYELYTDVFLGRSVELPQAPGAEYPMKAILTAVREQRPKIVFICSPNNPTGAEVDLESVRRICAAADGLVFFDEAYAEFTEQSAVDLLPHCPNLIVSRTFSKAFSMAGLRFGYLIASAEIIEQLRKVNLPYGVNIFTETAAVRLLDHEQELMRNVAYLKAERERLFSALSSMPGIEVFPSKANFLLLRSSAGVDLFQALKSRGVLVRDVSSYPLLKGCVRVTVGFHEENDLFLEVLTDVLRAA